MNVFKVNDKGTETTSTDITPLTQQLTANTFFTLIHCEQFEHTHPFGRKSLN